MAASNLDDPAAWGVTMHEAKLNGLRMRWADTATTDAERARPVVLFMHGFPELWFSWRHQLKAVHAAGYRGIAPDMRGYGGSDVPEHMANYSVYSLAGDMLALLQRIGASTAALVGHDHGAMLGWKLALLHPDVFVCYMAMSVPYSRSPIAPVSGMRKFFGDESKPEKDPNFFYVLHHQLPTAAKDYEQDTRAALMAFFGDSATPEATPAPVTSGKLFVEGKAEPVWRRMAQQTQPPRWMSQAEVNYFVKEFERTGWDGGLNWYRVMDLDWEATPQLKGLKVKQPAAFIGGSADGVIVMSGGKKRTTEGLKKVCEQLDFVRFLDGAGHWVQQERPQEVNKDLLEFLGKHREKFSAASTGAPRSRL